MASALSQPFAAGAAASKQKKGTNTKRTFGTLPAVSQCRQSSLTLSCNIMIDLSLPEIAAFRHSLKVFMAYCLLIAFLIPWAAALRDNLKGKR